MQNATETQSVREHRGRPYMITLTHPAADMFPWLGEVELQDLGDHIARSGQTDKIVRLPDGRVVDGRTANSRAGSRASSSQYATEDLTDDKAISLVVSRNIHRRSLTASQRQAVAADLATMRQGERTDKEPSATLPKVSQADAAKQMEVSPRSVTSARRSGMKPRNSTRR